MLIVYLYMRIFFPSRRLFFFLSLSVFYLNVLHLIRFTSLLTMEAVNKHSQVHVYCTDVSNAKWNKMLNNTVFCIMNPKPHTQRERDTQIVCPIFCRSFYLFCGRLDIMMFILKGNFKRSLCDFSFALLTLFDSKNKTTAAAESASTMSSLKDHNSLV